MLAMKAVMQAGKMGLALKPRSIFQHPTIADWPKRADQTSTGPHREGRKHGESDRIGTLDAGPNPVSE